MRPVCPECGSVAIDVNKALSLGSCTQHSCSEYGKLKKLTKLVQSGNSFPEQADIVPGGYRKRVVRVE